MGRDTYIGKWGPLRGLRADLRPRSGEFEGCLGAAAAKGVGDKKKLPHERDVPSYSSRRTVTPS